MAIVKSEYNVLNPTSGQYDTHYLKTSVDQVSGLRGELDTMSGDITTLYSGKANLASPALTGTPTAPTPATTDNSTKIATTAYVNNACLTATASSLTFNVATSYCVASCRKANKFCNLKIDIRPSADVSPWTLIATIPENYRPVVEQHIIGYNYSNGSIREVLLNPNGKIMIINGGSLPSEHNFHLDCTYMV